MIEDSDFLIFSGAVSCYCCERYSVRIPKVKKQTKITGNDPEDVCAALTRADSDEWRPTGAESETDC